MEERSVLAVVGEPHVSVELNKSSDKTIISSVLGGTAGAAASEYKGGPVDVSDSNVSFSSDRDGNGGVVGGVKSGIFGSPDSLGTSRPVPSSLLLWLFTVDIDS